MENQRSVSTMKVQWCHRKAQNQGDKASTKFVYNINQSITQIYF